MGCGTDGLEHLQSDGDPFANWHTHLPPKPAYAASYYGPSSVSALALVGNRLYVAGVFGVEALDAATGARLWLTPVNLNAVKSHPPEQGVLALAANGNAVFAGGSFVAANGSLVEPLVTLNPRTGAMLRWHSPALSPGPFWLTRPHLLVFPVGISALALDGSRLFIAGGITAVDGQLRDNVAELDTTTGALLPWRPRPTETWNRLVGTVGITVTHGLVFTSTFGNENGVTGAISETTGRLIPSLASLCDDSCAISGDILYGASGDNPNNVLNAANLETRTATPWAPHLNVYQEVEGMAISGNQLLVVGPFTNTLG